MKKMLLLAALLVGLKSAYAQVVRLNMGITSSNLRVAAFKVKNDPLVTPTIMAGIEYLHKKWFYLSSEVGYIALGERHSQLIGGPGGNMSWYNFAQVNTTFRARHLSPSGHTEFFAGAGPYVNILLNNNKNDHPLFADYDTKTFNTGIKTEVGIVRNINRFRVGLMGNYLVRLSPLATSPYTKINYNAWGITLGLGYKLH